MLIQFKVFALALVFPVLCLLLSAVDVVQAEGGWSVLYLSRPSSTVIGRLGTK